MARACTFMGKPGTLVRSATPLTCCLLLASVPVMHLFMQSTYLLLPFVCRAISLLPFGLSVCLSNYLSVCGIVSVCLSFLCMCAYGVSSATVCVGAGIQQPKGGECQSAQHWGHWPGLLQRQIQGCCGGGQPLCIPPVPRLGHRSASKFRQCLHHPTWLGCKQHQSSALQPVVLCRLIQQGSMGDFFSLPAHKMETFCAHSCCIHEVLLGCSWIG